MLAGDITSDKFASGQLVTGINGITDAVTIDSSYGLSVTTLGNTITIDNTLPGLDTAVGTLPLTLTLDVTKTQLTGSIAVTPVNDGGAVALQNPAQPALPGDPFTPVIQLGSIGVSSLFTSGITSFNATYETVSSILLDPSVVYIQTSNDLPYGLVVLNPDSEPIIYGHSSGTLNTVNNLTRNNAASTTLTVQEDPWTGTNPLKLHLTAVAADEAENFINLPIEIDNTLHFSQTTTNANPERIGVGKITGLSSIEPVIDLNIGTVPAIRLGFGSPVEPAPALTIYGTDQQTPNIVLNTNGTITAKTLNVNSVYATTAYVNQPQTIPVNIVGGPQVIIADASAGQVIVQLPVIPGDFTKSLTVTVKKADISTNAVSIVRGTGSLIEGSIDPINLVTGYAYVTLVSSGLNWYKISGI
jgi:hypothetical protein